MEMTTPLPVPGGAHPLGAHCAKKSIGMARKLKERRGVARKLKIRRDMARTLQLHDGGDHHPPV
jgi:hypothetical protein